ncbi:MAG: hypothetical protein LPL29_00870 [Alphaproteobacteria bacterium]|nr:hypothetical protein [Alphaproteobacteria bacterium]
MAVFVLRDGQMVDKATGEPMNAPDAPLATPQVRGDLPGYRSPIDGKWIEGRRARRYDLESNNCVDANDLPSPTKGRLRNERFARKHGLSHLVGQ